MSSTYLAILETEQRWRALTPGQALCRSLLLHSMVLVSLSWLAIYYVVPQHRDAGAVITFELGPNVNHCTRNSSERKPTLTQVALNGPQQAPVKSQVLRRQPAVVAHVPRSGRHLAVPTRSQPLSISFGSQPLPGKVSPVPSAPIRKAQPLTPLPPLSPQTSKPAGPAFIEVTNAPNSIAPTPQLSAGTRPALEPGVVSPANVPGSARSTFAQMDAEACREFFHAEAIANSKPEQARRSYERALALMVEAVPILKQEVGAGHREIAFATFNLGRCYYRTGHLQEARQSFEHAAFRYQRQSGDESMERANTLVWLADVLKDLKMYAEAETALKDSLPAYKQHFGDESKEVKGTYHRLAHIFDATNRKDLYQTYHRLSGHP